MANISYINNSLSCQQKPHTSSVHLLLGFKSWMTLSNGIFSLLIQRLVYRKSVHTILCACGNRFERLLFRFVIRYIVLSIGYFS